MTNDLDSQLANLIKCLFHHVQEKEHLLLISSNTDEGKQQYQKWIVQDVRSIIHILEDLPSCKPPLDYVCELLPRLQARYYSISSSFKVSTCLFFFRFNAIYLVEFC